MQLNDFSPGEGHYVFFLNHRSPFSTCTVKDEGLQTTETWWLLTAPTISTPTTSLRFALPAELPAVYLLDPGKSFQYGVLAGGWERAPKNSCALFNTNEKEGVYRT